jgi:hypothetical protein
MEVAHFFPDSCQFQFSSMSCGAREMAAMRALVPVPSRKRNRATWLALPDSSKPGGKPMEHSYRAYEIAADGHIMNRRELLNCLSDEDARRDAKKLLGHCVIELWDGACLLERFEPRSRH